MSTYTYPAHQDKHSYPANAPHDCRFCKAETDRRIAALEANLAANRDHRDDGNPFLGLLVAATITGTVLFAALTLHAAYTSGALLNGYTAWAAVSVAGFLFLTTRKA